MIENMTTELTMLGTGNATVTKCYNTCFTIKTGKNILLVDAGGGNGILGQLEKAGIAISEIHDMFVTHAHTDHILGAVWMPAYGPEQRGGTANVTVIVSDDKISSPILSKYDAAIILNQPSLEKFESKVKPGGILIYDGYGIINPPTRKDIKVYRIDAMDAANEMNNAKAFNMIVLGGLLKLRPIVTLENVIKGLKKTLPERHHHLIPMNEEAIKKGMELIREV